ncbi:MAG: HAD family acid phosphatase [bacterium]
MPLIRMQRMTLGILSLSLVFSACSQNHHPHEKLDGTLWVQTSIEYRMAASQAYSLAKLRLDKGLADPAWTAALEQKGGLSQLPPAVILDIDETVLDNSGFEARLVEKDKSYDEDAWKEWALEAKALAVPGALEFVMVAQRKGVEVFFVTNRNHEVEDATRQNLIDLGFSIDGQHDVILTKNEREDWGSDKTTRRAYLAKKYRIVLLIGDDLNDFVSARVGPEQRAELAAQHGDLWGEKWIVLPNPMYGSWEGALYNFQYDLTDAQKQERKYRMLKTYE